MLNYSLYILQLNLSHHVPETYHQPLKVRRVKFNIFYYKQIKSRYVTFRAERWGNSHLENFSGKEENLSGKQNNISSKMSMKKFCYQIFLQSLRKLG